MTEPTIHASAVLVGSRAVLIRGRAGAGKSHLVLGLLEAARAGLVPFARLVTDDRAHVEAVNGRLLVRPPAALRGLVEMRGVGIIRLPYEGTAVVGLVVDLASEQGARLPDQDDRRTVIAGIPLPRLPVSPGIDPLPLVLMALHTRSNALEIRAQSD